MYRIIKEFGRWCLTIDDKIYLKWLDLKDRHKTYKIVRAWEINMKEAFGMNKEHWFLVFAPKDAYLYNKAEGNLISDELLREILDDEE